MRGPAGQQRDLYRLQEGGYPGGLGILHPLHPDYNYPGEQDKDELFMHAVHCLESLDTIQNRGREPRVGDTSAQNDDC